MGNQMFQYSLGRVLAIKNNSPLYLDIEFFKTSKKPKREYSLSAFNIKGDILPEKEVPFFYRQFNIKIINLVFKLIKIVFLKHEGVEKSFNFTQSIFETDSEVYLDGYWQSYKYFEQFEDVIKDDFKIKTKLADTVSNLSNEIKNNKSVCVQVRRGDYVGNSFYEEMGIEYYNKALEIISSNTEIDKIYVFSDDINWCEKNLSFKIPTFFVGNKYQGKFGEGHIFLMSCCKNFIIANSTFGWWGAWLSTHDKKIVVCPKKWFRDESINTSDLIPEKWTRI